MEYAEEDLDQYITMNRVTAIDEIRPVSRWREFGYASREAAAQDWNNLQAAHYCCNAMKSNRTSYELDRPQSRVHMNVSDGKW